MTPGAFPVVAETGSGAVDGASLARRDAFPGSGCTIPSPVTSRAPTRKFGQDAVVVFLASRGACDSLEHPRMVPNRPDNWEKKNVTARGNRCRKGETAAGKGTSGTGLPVSGREAKGVGKGICLTEWGS